MRNEINKMNEVIGSISNKYDAKANQVGSRPKNLNKESALRIKDYRFKVDEENEGIYRVRQAHTHNHAS